MAKTELQQKEKQNYSKQNNRTIAKRESEIWQKEEQN